MKKRKRLKESSKLRHRVAVEVIKPQRVPANICVKFVESRTRSRRICGSTCVSIKAWSRLLARFKAAIESSPSALISTTTFESVTPVKGKQWIKVSLHQTYSVLDRPFLCTICGKRFLTGSVYYQHRLIHRGERRYGCEECGKRFYRADALKNHLVSNWNETPQFHHIYTFTLFFDSEFIQARSPTTAQNAAKLSVNEAIVISTWKLVIRKRRLQTRPRRSVSSRSAADESRTTRAFIARNRKEALLNENQHFLSLVCVLDFKSVIYLCFDINFCFHFCELLAFDHKSL